ARTNDVIRFDLNAAILALSFNWGVGIFDVPRRRARLNFGRFADDRRRLFLAFECLAKTVGKGLWPSLSVPIDGQLPASLGNRRKPGNLVELVPQVNNIFL